VGGECGNACSGKKGGEKDSSLIEDGKIPEKDLVIDDFLEKKNQSPHTQIDGKGGQSFLHRGLKAKRRVFSCRMFRQKATVETEQ